MIASPRDLLPLLYYQAESLRLANGAPITEWRDQGGRAINARGLVVGQEPNYDGSISPYGGPSVLFATSDILEIPSLTHNIGTGAFTSWVLIRPTNSASVKDIWSTLTGPHIGLAIKDLKPFFVGSSIAGGAGQVGTTAMTAAAWHVMLLQRSAAGVLTCYVDGVADATTPTDAGNMTDGSSFYLGGGWNGNITAEYRDFGLVARVLTAAEREDLTMYLLNRRALPAPSIPRTLNWKIQTDWGQDGSYAQAYDDISNRVDIIPGMSWTRGRDPARSYGDPRIPKYQAVGLNDDRFFSTDWPSSPIYQVRPEAKPIRKYALVGSSWDANSAELVGNAPVYANGTDEIPTFTGLLDRVKHRPSYQERRVDLVALGNLIKLQDRRTVSTGLYTNITTGAAWAVLMAALGISSTAYVVSGTAVTLLYWWLDRADPFGAALELLHTEGPGAAVYEDSAGRYIFEGQNYRTTAARSLTPQARFMPDGVNGLLFTTPEHEDGADAIINVATYHIRERAVQSLQRVWSYSPSVTLGPSATRLFPFDTSDPLSGLVTTLLAGTDYVLGSGSLTAATVVATTATHCVVTLTAGAGGAVINAGTLQVRAQPISVVNEYDVANSVTQTASITTYGEKSRSFTGRSEIDPNVAISVCDTAVQRNAQPRALNRWAVVGKTGDEIRQMLTLQVSDRVAYREDQTGQNHDAWIESIDPRAIDGLLIATLSAERTIAQGYGRYDSGVYDTAIYGQ